ncbi:sugar transporter domain-containing protein [Phthorimaea operculella]|nr:sugar transporter domain-containing protein [Phthorimaea operculella]
MSVIFQALCTSVICYLSMSMGIIFAWPSCTLNLFESHNTTLHRPMTETELALFGSLSSIGALISTPVAGYFLDVVGRKYCAVFASLCYVIAWGLISCTTQVEVILAAVFIAGLGASAMLIVRVYVSEICSMVFYSLGLLISYALGESLAYHYMVYTCLAMSVAGVAMLGLMKESPTYLMKKGFEKEAAESVAFYRRIDCDSKDVLQEMDTLRRAFNPDLEDETGEAEKLTEEKVEKLQTKKLSFWKFVRNSRSTRKATILTITLVTAGTFQGLLVVQVYAKPLFEEAVPGMSSVACCVVQALVTVIAGLTSGYLSDLAGRRVRTLASMISWYLYIRNCTKHVICSTLRGASSGD